MPIKGQNRYTENSTTEESTQLDMNKILLDVMKQEFPNDLFYAFGNLSPSPSEQVAIESVPDPKEKINNLEIAKRNEREVAQMHVNKDTYLDYNLQKTYPTINEDELDEIIDEEWEYFEDPEEDELIQIVPPAVSGLFLTNAETELTDIHDLYIRFGPQTLGPDDNDPGKVFCVFYIQNGRARPIPNYKTLEVMLVERGLGYSIISEATPDQLKDFDLALDGIDSINQPPTQDDTYEEPETSPYAEFVERTMNDRASEHTRDIRFRSGYRPKAPFERDPADYIKPEAMRRIEGRAVPVDPETGEELPADQYVIEDPDDIYFDKVFQKQTTLEKLRAQFEGKIVIKEWPAGYVQSTVENETEVLSDDLVLGVRMMINGHWKQIRDSETFRLFGALNEYDLSSLNPLPKPIDGVDAGNDRYGAQGLIQLLIDRGGITRLPPDGAGPDPVWDSFAHIVEADDDGVSGLDIIEYKEYLDNFSNGGKPFEIEILQPYEPPGSIHYYPEQQYAALIAQALEQAQIDEIKDIIFEIWPGIAAASQNLRIQLESMPKDFTEYVTGRFGSDGKGGKLYKLWISNDGNWKYVKRKGRKKKKKTKTKESSSKLFKVITKSNRIKFNLSESEENKIVSKYKWMKSVHRDKFAGWLNGNSGGQAVGAGTAGAVALTGTGLAIAYSLAATAGYAQAVVAATGPLVLAGSSGLAAGALPAAFLGPTGFLGSGTAAVLMNPITIGVAAGAALFFIADALIGEVPNDKYLLPPWRFMKDNWYLKACIWNEIDDQANEFLLTAQYCDGQLPEITQLVSDMCDMTKGIDAALLEASTVEEFQEIYDLLLALKEFLDNFNAGGLLSLLNEFKSEVDEYFIKQLRAQYNAIQYVRKKVHKKIGKKKKFAIVWPKGPQRILNEYIPGLTYDNYLPF
jgi:hypothetical protein